MSKILEQLADALGADMVITEGLLMDQRKYDYWAYSHLRDFTGESMDLPLCVVQPKSTKDVQTLIRLANEGGTAVVPYGLGSGVCGGVLAHKDRILLDMSEMNQIVEIDEVNLLASFQAGKNGMEAEDAVKEKGLTIGHWPQSIAVSSVGGWVATRASGQFSTAYGNIEDIIYSMEVVLPNGDIVTLGKAPRAAAGPDLRHIIMGSEGIMGVITQVTFSLRRAAPAKAYTAFYAPDMKIGIEAQRRVIQAGLTPPVMRLYDALESPRNFGKFVRENQGMLIMVHEGHENIIAAEKQAVADICQDVGLEAAPEGAVLQWLDHRNNVPTWEDFFKNKVIVDTIEVSAKWTDIINVYDGAIEALNKIPGMIMASAHSSHVYISGINLYFTFVANCAEQSDMTENYLSAWAGVVEATAKAGGGIAHHHGVGRVRQNYLAHDLGKEGIDLLRTLKNAVDPKNIMNPEVVLPNG